MGTTPKFLIVDDVCENRYLIAKTLIRKFPQAVVQECQDAVTALASAGGEKLAAIVVHRATGLSGPEMIARLRGVNPTVPIVMVSGRESCPEAITAGATAFLNYDAWLRIGTVVEEMLSGEYVKPLTSAPFTASPESERWNSYKPE